jgi:hypothetical protein
MHVEHLKIAKKLYNQGLSGEKYYEWKQVTITLTNNATYK